MTPFDDGEDRHSSRTRGVVTRCVVALALLAVFVPVSQARVIDGDEGFLLYAARLVSEGQRLHRDFFFTHMPGVPWVFGGVFALFGTSWRVARLVSAVMAAGIGMLVFEAGYLSTRKMFWALVATFLYACCGYSIGWLAIAKTLNLALFLIFLGAFLLLRGGRWSSFLAGALIMMSSEARLYVGVVGLNAIVFILRRDGLNRRGFSEIVKLAGGACAGALFLLPAILPDPRTFYFENIQFLRIRNVSQESVFGPLRHKFRILTGLVPLYGWDGGGAVQFAMMLIPAIANLVSKRTPRNSLFGPIWVTLLVVNLLPYPTFTQYTCLLVPFVAVEAVSYLSRLPSLSGRIRIGVWVTLGAFLCLGGWDAARFTDSGVEVGKLPPGAIQVGRWFRPNLTVPGLYGLQGRPAWSISNVEKIGRMVDEQGVSEAGSWWPGYFVATRTHIFKRLSNDFGVLAADRVPVQERERLHVMTRSETLDLIEQRGVPVFVAGNWLPPTGLSTLAAAGYRKVGDVANATIWRVP